MSVFGLPSIPNLSAKSVLTGMISYGQAQLWSLLTSEPIWGIYQPGSSTERAVEVDSIVAVSVSAESDVPDYRLQTGSFASYNKVPDAIKVTVKMSKGGSDDERKTFLNWLETSRANPVVYDILMREESFHNFTLVSFEYDRTRDGGVDLIVADCEFQEVREAPEQYYDAQQGKADTSNTGDADAVPTKPDKNVSAKSAGNVGSDVAGIFDLTRIRNNVSSSVSSISQSAKEIAGNVSKKVAGYWDLIKNKVSGVFG